MSAPPIAKSYAWVPGAMLALPSILTLPGAVHAGIAFVNSLCSGPPARSRLRLADRRAWWRAVRRSTGLCVARPGARLTQLGRPDCRQWPYCPVVPDGTKRSTGIRVGSHLRDRVAWLYSDFDVGISSPSRLTSLARHEDLSGTTERRAVSYQ